MTTTESITLWVLDCPFRKDGAPVTGTFGARTEPVVILTLEAWKQLATEHPELGRRVFRVGVSDVADAQHGIQTSAGGA